MGRWWKIRIIHGNDDILDEINAELLAWVPAPRCGAETNRIGEEQQWDILLSPFLNVCLNPVREIAAQAPSAGRGL